MKVEVEVRTLGEYFRLRFINQHLSMREVASQTGLSVSVVCRVANGEKFDIDTLLRVAKWCELKPEQVWLLLENQWEVKHDSAE